MNKRKIGGQYEEQAAEFLARQGYRIVEKNYRSRAGEIDLVGWDGAYLVFVEVKYRRDDGKGRALEAVGPRKQHRISRAAFSYLGQREIPQEVPCRFDVVGIDNEKVTLVKDAFDFCYGNPY